MDSGFAPLARPGMTEERRMNIAPKPQNWQPPERVSREDTLARSDAVLAMPDIPLHQTEDIFRIQALGLDWDMGVTVYEPADPSHIARGADGKRIGIFLLHGGSGDYKSMEPIARLYAGKFGCKAVAMTFPGRLYLDDASRDCRVTPSIPTALCARRSGFRVNTSRPTSTRWCGTPLCACATAPARWRAPSPAPSSTIAWRPGRSPLSKA
jgi:hypothetical protein